MIEVSELYRRFDGELTGSRRPGISARAASSRSTDIYGILRRRTAKSR
jgi:hypothetical protein